MTKRQDALRRTFIRMLARVDPEAARAEAFDSGVDEMARALHDPSNDGMAEEALVG